MKRSKHPIPNPTYTLGRLTRRGYNLRSKILLDCPFKLILNPTSLEVIFPCRSTHNFMLVLLPTCCQASVMSFVNSTGKSALRWGRPVGPVLNNNKFGRDFISTNKFTCPIQNSHYLERRNFIHCGNSRVGNLLFDFYEQTDRFLWAKEQNGDLLTKTRNSLFCSFLKSNGSKLLTSFFCNERWEWFTHSHSFVKSNISVSLQSLFIKERWSKEQWEQFALGKKGEKQ